MKLIRALLTATVTLIGSVSAHAQAISGQGTWETTLLGRDVGHTGRTNAFYDTALNITWLRDANVNGSMDWNTATSWVSNLTVGGIGGWRLPTMADPSAGCVGSYSGSTCGYNVATSSSEMASLFYNTLGNKSHYDSSGNRLEAGWGLSNTGRFQNMQSFLYWLDAEYAPSPSLAWVFFTNDGGQGGYAESVPLYAMAVHPGDVGTVAASVPEPETYAMLLAGLGLIGAASRRSIDKPMSDVGLPVS